jgi:hypothetical protein
VFTIAVPASTPYSAFNVTVTGNNPAPIAPTTLTVTVAAKIAVNPTATASKSYTVGTSVTVGLNITDSPAFGGFIVAIFFNTSILQFSRLDYSGTGYVFGNDVFVSDECLNLADVPGAAAACTDKTLNAPGVLTLFVATESGNNIGTNGILATLTFRVVGTGLSPIHFVFQEVQTEPSGVQLQTVGYDGYFTNADCGSGNLCKPPVLSFVPPVRPVALRPVSFNATALSQNPGGSIREYNWTSGNFADVQSFNSPSTKGGKLWSNATIIFLQFGQHIVTLSAQDNFGARAYYTVSINVFRVWVDLGISALAIDHTIGVFPGTLVHIVATATNNGVNPENSTLRLAINNQNVATQPIVNLAPILESSLSYNWSTAGITPRVYRLDVTLDEVRNGNTSRILENDTAIIHGQLIDPNNLRVAFVQLIEQVPSGIGVFLGLNLPETLGLGIVLIAVIVFAAGLVRKSRARPEPL